MKLFRVVFWDHEDMSKSWPVEFKAHGKKHAMRLAYEHVAKHGCDILENPEEIEEDELRVN